MVENNQNCYSIFSKALKLHFVDYRESVIILFNPSCIMIQICSYLTTFHAKFSVEI